MNVLCRKNLAKIPESCNFIVRKSHSFSVRYRRTYVLENFSTYDICIQI